MSTTFARFCSSCGVALPTGVKFCAQCGALVAPTAVISPKVDSGERRQATILFCDLVGYTRLSSTRDPEETHALLTRYFEAVDGIIRSYGGSIDKHIGDGVMGVFGAPVAHGNDPERAVRAALDIHPAVNALDGALAVHIGIASGEVVAARLGSTAHHEYTMTGAPVNLAARLCDRATSGETVVSGPVRDAIGAALHADDLGEITLKGLTRPLQAWHVRGIGEAGSATSTHAIAGRQGEIGQFSAAIETARAAGRGHMLVVRGDPGIGKTRLIEEFGALAVTRGFALHRALVLDFGAHSYDPVRTLVRSLCGLEIVADAAARAEATDAGTASGCIAPDDRLFINDLLDLPLTLDQRSTYDAMDSATRSQRRHEVVSKLVQHAAKQTPLLIVVEDLHWADTDTLAQLAVLAAAVMDCTAVLVATTRIEGDPIDSKWRARAGRIAVSTLDLGPLRDADALAVACAVGGTGQNVQECIARAEGNPLFLIQLLQSAADSGSESIPQSIQSLVQARADSLSPTNRRALQAAAVIGQRFNADVVRNLIGDPAYTCDDLVERGLVRPMLDGFLFGHALIRDGVYRSLLRETRRDFHKAAASWYAATDPLLYAEHLALAEDPGAAMAFLAAARAMQSRYDYGRAQSLAERGRGLATHAAERHAFAVLDGELMRDLGDGAGAITAYERALMDATDDIDRCRAWIGLADGYRLKDGGAGGRVYLDQAEVIAERQGLDLERAQICRLRGSLDFLGGRTAQSLAEQERAVSYARRAGNPEWEARAMSGLADAHYALGRMRTAHADFQMCLDLCAAHGIGRVAISQMPMRAITRSYLNQLEIAITELEAAAEEARRALNRRAQILCHMGAAEMLLQMDDLGRADSHLAAGLEIARSTGARWFETFCLIHAARPMWSRGDIATAKRMLADAANIMPSGSERAIAGFLWGTMALTTDDNQEADRALAAGAAILAHGAISHNHFWFRRDEMEVYLRRGYWDAAIASADALADYTRAEPLPWSDFYIARVRALAAIGRGGHTDENLATLRRLRSEAATVKLLTALPLIDAALAG